MPKLIHPKGHQHTIEYMHNTSSMKLGEAIYKTQQEQAKPEATESTSGGEKEDVVDADFEEVKK